jgi:hypothetical protein
MGFYVLWNAKQNVLRDPAYSGTFSDILGCENEDVNGVQLIMKRGSQIGETARALLWAGVAMSADLHEQCRSGTPRLRNSPGEARPQTSEETAMWPKNGANCSFWGTERLRMFLIEPPGWGEPGNVMFYKRA